MKMYASSVLSIATDMQYSFGNCCPIQFAQRRTCWFRGEHIASKENILVQMRANWFKGEQIVSKENKLVKCLKMDNKLV